MDHRTVTRREFAHQASSFERAGSLFSDGDILNWIDRHAPVDSGDWLLDVAGGTGNLGRHLGRRARSTVVLDLTPEMLAAGARAAADEGREDVLRRTLAYASDATANRRWRGRPLFARCGSELSSGGGGYERHKKPAAPKLQAPPAEAALRCLVT